MGLNSVIFSCFSCSWKIYENVSERRSTSILTKLSGLDHTGFPVQAEPVRFNALSSFLRLVPDDKLFYFPT